MNRLLYIFALTFLAINPLSAEQIILGTPVAGAGETEQVGVVSDGWIYMHIPLEGSGTYGVDDYGTQTTWHHNDFAADISGGAMDMWLYFGSIEQPATNALLELKFWDLDLQGVNDPNSPSLWLIEGVEFYDELGNQRGQVWDISHESSGIEVSGDYQNQRIVLDLLDLGYTVDEQFHMRLVFNSNIYYGEPGWLENTFEKLMPTLSTYAVVPEPQTYLMLGALLCLVGWGARRTPRSHRA